MTPARYFFVVAAITMLAIMVAGFHPYYLRGEGMACPPEGYDFT